jgi:HEAT repeat protein
MANCSSDLHAAQTLLCKSRLSSQAMRLGKEAMPILHELLDHRRLQVVISAYNLLGEMADESSLPYLQAGLYPQRTSAKLRFPTAEYAANALPRYSMHARSRVISTITDQVRAQDVSIIIREMDHDTVYNHLMHLYLENKLCREWEGHQESLALLLRTDEEKSWPLVEELMTKGESFYSFAAFR